MGEDQEGPQRLSFRAAARLVGVSERTMRRWAADGRITPKQDAGGPPWVDRTDALQLCRKRLPDTPPAAPAADNSSIELETLRVETAALRRENTDLREQRDSWRAMAEQAQTNLGDLLKALPPGPPAQPTPDPTPRRRWWPFGRR